MRTRFAAVLTAFVLMTTTACGTDVPAGLADKVEAGCPGLLKPEPLAVITKDLVVSEVNGVDADGCQVFVSTGRKALSVGIVAYPSPEESERLTPMLCTDGKLDVETKACTAGTVEGQTYSLHAVAGRWNVRVAVFEIPATDEVKDAVQQIVEDLRNSDKTRG
ncbi:hypothetical protein ACFWN2_03260 [Lentzea sp. NPDC058436]|uniref:hypothetical protein n=1 Tax=Lentzea sp. NPDC058436 TaxID=3346499 RepID=UPI003648B27B